MGASFILLALQLVAFKPEDCGNCVQARVPVYQWQALGNYASAAACAEASKTLIAAGTQAKDVTRFVCVSAYTGKAATS